MAFPLGNPFKMGPVRTGNQGFGPRPAQPEGLDQGGIDAALAPYGVHLPSSYEQPGIAENTGWGQRHPGFARGIDNALIAVGGMGPSGDTAGENISNVARGVMGIGPYRRQFASEQAMLPFQIAKEVGGLQAQQSYMKMQEAMAGYYGDRGQAALEANTQKMQAAQLRSAITSAKEMQVMKDEKGNDYVAAPYIDPQDPDMNVQWRKTPIDVPSFKAAQSKQRLASRFPGYTGSLYSGYLASKYGGLDKIPDNLSKEDIKYGADLAMQTSGTIFRANDQDTRDRHDKFLATEVDAMHKSLPDLSVYKNKEWRSSAEEAATNAWIADPSHINPRTNKPYRGFEPEAVAAGQAVVAKQESADKAKYDQQVRDFGEYNATIPPEHREEMGGFFAWQRLKQNPPNAMGTPPVGTQTPNDLNSTIQQLRQLLRKQ